MIITRTPLRISFVGGGSDMAEFYTESEGAVLSTSIDKYIYIATNTHFNSQKINLKHAIIEAVDHFNNIQHPITREVFHYFGFPEKIDINVMSDLPHGTGMGSSSAFTVSLLQNIFARQSQYPDRNTLARIASEIEIERLREPIGKQDQYASAFGGFNIIKFHSDHTVTVLPVRIPIEHRSLLQRHLLLFYTGINRKASTVLAEQKHNMSAVEKRLILREMVDLVPPLADAMMNGNIASFGEILHENWKLKQSLAKSISNEEINGFYDTALKSGAMGGKLLGAGGGGFLLFVAAPDCHGAISGALPQLKKLEFEFESCGSTIIYPTKAGSGSE